VFFEGFGDHGVLDIVLEHEVDHVAKRFGKAGDFAVACFGFGGAGGRGLIGGGWRGRSDWFNAWCVFRVACSVILRRSRQT